MSVGPGPENRTDAYDPGITVHGAGRPLVFAPGMDGTGLLFYRQIERLSPDYRVVTYRLRDRAPAMDRLVADLRDVVQRTVSPDERYTLVGESFGGAIALSFALAHPERIDSLVIVNSFPFFRPQVRLRLAATAIRAFPWRAMTLVRRLTGFRLHSRYTHRNEVRRFLELTRGTRRQGYVNRLRILMTYDIRHRLQEIRVPTLFLAADRDRLVPAVEQARYMADRVPDARLEILEGHGHICFLAPNLDLAALLRDWRGA